MARLEMQIYIFFAKRERENCAWKFPKNDILR